jgi:hypothetical protein
LFGQGNCHGCSSIISSFVYPFKDILGIDIRYRGGFSFGAGGPSSNEVERHQWVEFTCRPSMKTFVVDLWYEGDCKQPAYLTYPVELAYKELFYPNGKLIIGSKS